MSYANLGELGTMQQSFHFEVTPAKNTAQTQLAPVIACVMLAGPEKLTHQMEFANNGQNSTVQNLVNSAVLKELSADQKFMKTDIDSCGLIQFNT